MEQTLSSLQGLPSVPEGLTLGISGGAEHRPLHAVVCAQHGRVANGVTLLRRGFGGREVPCERTKTWKHEIKSPVEANSGRVTDRGEKARQKGRAMNKSIIETGENDSGEILTQGWFIN
jgi:hypothetical protein